MTGPDTFDVCGPLPEGTTVLEASAGTGKTFTIAALATRYVAEGHAELRELMLVTFGRLATQELRERVRERLVSAERGLADPAHARAAVDDDLLRLLADADDEEVALRRKRLAGALADFDAATLTTTHGFCQQMLRGLGVAGDHEPDAVFVESLDDLVVEVTGDLYLRKFGRPDSSAPQLSYSDALATVRAAVEDGQAVLAPDDAHPDSTAGQRHGIAAAARREVELRKRRRRLIAYDDLLTRLCAALDDPTRGADAQQRVRSRYKVVMVDEFQDTDPVQWRILQLAFDTYTTLVLIGDPKQAIYAFRGGDVVAYLAATERATTRSTLAPQPPQRRVPAHRAGSGVRPSGTGRSPHHGAPGRLRAPRPPTHRSTGRRPGAAAGGAPRRHRHGAGQDADGRPDPRADRRRPRR